MWIACLLSAALLGATSPQGTLGPQGTGARTAAGHGRALWSERALAFLDALAAADPDARAGAEAFVLESRPGGAGTSWYPPIEVLMAAKRELTGPLSRDPLDPRRAREQRELQAVADAVDLVVVPGGFAPRDEGLGEQTTVFVRSAFRPAGYGAIELRLSWRSEDGRLEVARSEPATIEALRAGFPMYVRPPRSAAGAWWLVPEVGRAGITAHGDGVRVDCAARFAEALDEPGAAPELAPGFASEALRGHLAALLGGGSRAVVALSSSELARALAGPAPRAPLPLELAFEDPASGPRYLWGCLPAGAPELALVILCADHELADLPLAGVLGERWRALADRRGALLFSVNAPSAAARRTTREVLEAAAAAAHRLGLPEDAPVVAVARGATAARLAFEPIEGLDAAVLSTVVRSPRPQGVLDWLPRLLVAPGGAEVFPDVAPEFTWVAGPEVPLLGDLELPALVETWLERR